jgi:hypothetical protein
MALTIVRVPNGEDVFGRNYIRTFDVTLDNSYPNSTGYTINANDVGLKNFLGADVIAGNRTSGGYSYIFDTNASPGDSVTALRLRLFWSASGGAAANVEVTNTTDVHLVVLRVQFRGF